MRVHRGYKSKEQRRRRRVDNASATFFWLKASELAPPRLAESLKDSLVQAIVNRRGPGVLKYQFVLGSIL